MIKFFINKKGQKIAYVLNKINETEPFVIAYHGYSSNMSGDKVAFIEDLCLKNNLNFLKFEYRGHGQSEGNIEDFNVSDWYQDCEDINTLIKGHKKLLVSSSLGGWLSFLYALKHPDEIIGLISIAPAIDLTEDLNKYLSLNLFLNLRTIYNHNIVEFVDFEGNKVRFNRDVIEDARKKKLLLLNNNINIDVPIEILHGLNDKAVHYTKSILLSSLVKSNKVNLHLFKDGDHFLSKPSQLRYLASAILNLIKE